MDDLDRKIAEALTAGDAEEYEQLAAEPSLFAQVFGVYQGRFRWLNLLATVYTFAFFILAIWCTVRFFGADDVRHTVMWGFGAMACMMAVAFLKMWFWMEMQKFSIIREIKRVELQVARHNARHDHAE